MSETAADPTGDADEEPRSREELVAELQLLAEQYEELRTSYVRAQQTRYRRTSLGFALLGVAALVGAALFPAVGSVLVALAGVGLFGAVLVRFLTPGTVIAADVEDEIYTAFATNEWRLVDELALSGRRRYVPPSGASGETRLFVPADDDTPVPGPAALSSLFVVTDDGARGVSLVPSGDRLFGSFERAVAGGVGDDPSRVAIQLCDALVEQFELCRKASPDVEPSDGRVTVRVSESAYGPVDRFDHPVASFIAVGVARALETVVDLEVAETDEPDEYLVTCRWERADAPLAPADESDAVTDYESE